MTVKRVDAYLTDDGQSFLDLKEATEHDNELAFFKLTEEMTIYGKIDQSDLWENKDKLIKFFIEKGYADPKAKE